MNCCNVSSESFVKHACVADTVLAQIFITYDWEKLQAFCQSPQKLSVTAFQKLLEFYVLASEAQQLSNIANTILDFVFSSRILPQDIKYAKQVRKWNNILKQFILFSRNAVAENNGLCEELIFGWWKNVSQKHRATKNVFSLMGHSPISENSPWKGVFSRKMLFQNKMYRQLLHSGEVTYLLLKGQAGYVIEHLCPVPLGKKQQTMSKDVYTLAARIPEKELIKYLNGNTVARGLRFFTIHPKGLKCLIKADYFGAIAQMANDFKLLLNNYPDTFLIPKQKYQTALSYALDFC